MSFMFATCDRKMALEFLKQYYPNHDITDTEESAKNILDITEKDIVRIPDPNFHRGEIFPSNNYKEDMREDVLRIIQEFHKNPGKKKE